MINQFKTDKPVIGVVAMPMINIDIIERLKVAEDKSHMAASFIKLIEGAGARVVPLRESFNDSKITEILEKINGVLLPGGLEDIIKSDYKRISHLAFKYSISKYENEGEIWPILGICRGFQQLLSLIPDAKHCITPTVAKNITIPLEFTDEAKESRLMSHASPALWKILKTKDITYNAHKNGFSPSAIRKSKKSNDFWRIISTNKDEKGKEFISTIEG